MEYLPTFPLECGHFSPHVGKYSLHGASGMDKQKQNNFYCRRFTGRFRDSIIDVLD